ncbi:hypothetical protein MOQ_004903 [Trypanosoma cruzi marinkellei]|uniref:Uncharacterized protein n=1 Tax=Trypanosoma cruzi marinkellei TaxID=85056 RepID=K2NQT4_TRYCR|nr:hypothetical protein MOQ_004903 [Trypanosoma cruzi marinkellei]
MYSSLASAGEWPDLSRGAQSSLGPFAKFRLWIFQIICRAYELGRDGARRHLEEGICRQLAPTVLFRACITEKESDGGKGTYSPKEELLRCPEALVKLMHSPTGSLDVDGMMYGVVNCACQYLRDACAFVELSMQGEIRGVGGGGGGGGGIHRKRGVLNSPASNDEVDGGLLCSSSSGVDVSGRAEHFGVRRHSTPSENVLHFQSGHATVYSSEDGTCAITGDPSRRNGVCMDECSVSSLQEARMMLQIIVGTAFSCPSEPLAKAFQLVIARELGLSLRPFEACCGVLKFLSPLDPALRVADEERRQSEMIGYLYYLNGVQTSASLKDALLSSLEATDSIQWFTAPSPAAVLPNLTRSLTGSLVEVMEELQQATDGIAAAAAGGGGAVATTSLSVNSTMSVAIPSFNRRRGGGCSNNRIIRSTGAEKELLNKERGKAGHASRQTVWDALCRCSLTIPKSVLSDRSDLLYRIFFKMGEVPQYYQILSIYPEVLRAHHATFQYIFFEEGPLPICERLMIALMAASRQKCEYLFSRFAALLLHFEEKQPSNDVVAENWLLQGPPPKLQALQRFIAIATHVPWQMKLNDIRGAMNAGWSIPGLIQASCIVAETLSLCSFVMGLFVPNDMWVSITLPSSLSSALSSCPVLGEVIDHQSRVNFTRYTGIDNIVSENRVKGSSSNVFTLSCGKFNWHEHGGTLMEQYYPGAATLINNELDAFSAVARKLTHLDCVGLTTPDYSPSNAFWFLRLYVQNIMGLMPDDYPYNSINKVLRRPAKLIAQSCTMRPETLSSSQMRLWVQMSSDPAPAPGELHSAKQYPTENLEEHQHLEVDMTEQKKQLIESLTAHKAPFTLSMPGTEAGRRPQPREDVLEAAISLHEERLIFLVVLATMEARKEGLFALLLYPMWGLLNNM